MPDTHRSSSIDLESSKLEQFQIKSEQNQHGDITEITDANGDISFRDPSFLDDINKASVLRQDDVPIEVPSVPFEADEEAE